MVSLDGAEAPFFAAEAVAAAAFLAGVFLALGVFSGVSLATSFALEELLGFLAETGS